jgi:hypothetical protein
MGWNDHLRACVFRKRRASAFVAIDLWPLQFLSRCALADWQASLNALYQLAKLNQLTALTIGARLAAVDA